MTAAVSVLNDAWVFVRRRNSRLRFSSAFVVRKRLPHRFRERVEREQVEAGLLERSRHRRAERRPLLHEGVIGRAGVEAGSAA